MNDRATRPAREPAHGPALPTVGDLLRLARGGWGIDLSLAHYQELGLRCPYSRTGATWATLAWHPLYRGQVQVVISGPGPERAPHLARAAPRGVGRSRVLGLKINRRGGLASRRGVAYLDFTMNAATRPACPVCTSPACLGYTCEPLPVERALEIVRASIAEREAYLELLVRLAGGAQGRLDRAIEAGERESNLISLDLEAARAWAGVARVRGYWQCQIASRARLERIPAGSLVDARDRVVAA